MDFYNGKLFRGRYSYLPGEYYTMWGGLENTG